MKIEGHKEPAILKASLDGPKFPGQKDNCALQKEMFLRLIY
jgi:hypothetical protein